MFNKEQMDRLLVVMDGKISAVNKQNYEAAAKLRDEEVSIVRSIYGDAKSLEITKLGIQCLCEYHDIPCDYFNMVYNSSKVDNYVLISTVLIDIKISTLFKK